MDLPLARSCANPHEALAPHHLDKARTEKGHRCLNLSRFFLLNLFTSTNLESKTRGAKKSVPPPKMEDAYACVLISVYRAAKAAVERERGSREERRKREGREEERDEREEREERGEREREREEFHVGSL